MRLPLLTLPMATLEWHCGLGKLNWMGEPELPQWSDAIAINYVPLQARPVVLFFPQQCYRVPGVSLEARAISAHAFAPELDEEVFDAGGPQDFPHNPHTDRDCTPGPAKSLATMDVHRDPAVLYANGEGCLPSDEEECTGFPANVDARPEDSSDSDDGHKRDDGWLPVYPPPRGHTQGLVESLRSFVALFGP